MAAGPEQAMKIALDPYMLRHVPLTELPGVVADLDYRYIELSPREDFLPFFNHPRADKATIARFKEALAGAGVGISSVLPLYRWSGSTASPPSASSPGRSAPGSPRSTTASRSGSTSPSSAAREEVRR